MFPSNRAKTNNQNFQNLKSSLLFSNKYSIYKKSSKWSTSKHIWSIKYIKDLLERYELIGFDVKKVINSENCAGMKQYFFPLCKKIIFEDLSKEYNDDWRTNITKIKEITPNLKFVILRSDYLKNNDNVIFNIDDLNIIKIN